MYSHQIKSFRNSEEMVKENTIVKHYAGSHAYGTALPSSDVDIRGIFCADPVNILTPFFPVKECEDKLEEDTKYFEVAHFLKLYLACNPNIVETLWVDKSDIIQSSEAYDYLHAYRRELLSSKIAHTTTGYAFAQLKRIKGHNKWINNPQPEESPKPYQFLSMVQWMGKDKNLKPWLPFFRDNYRLIPYGGNIFGVYPWRQHQIWDNNGNLNTKFDETSDRSALVGLEMILKWNKEEYKLAKEKHEQYWNWKENRNETRSELEEHFGYDTKHAMHLVRLLRMGVEALKTGEVIVKRPDAEELLSIRRGAWTYEEVVEYADKMDKEVKDLYQKTDLRKKPNIKLAAEVLMHIQHLVWGG